MCGNRNSYSFKILKEFREGNIEFAISTDIFLEYESVLKRKNILKLLQLTISDIEIFLDYLALKSVFSLKRYRWRPNLFHEGDNKFIECAINSGSEFIITYNKKDFFGADLKHFGYMVATPNEFFKFLED